MVKVGEISSSGTSATFKTTYPPTSKNITDLSTFHTTFWQ